MVTVGLTTTSYTEASLARHWLMKFGGKSPKIEVLGNRQYRVTAKFKDLQECGCGCHKV
jgi:hypothetical protein